MKEHCMQGNTWLWNVPAESGAEIIVIGDPILEPSSPHWRVLFLFGDLIPDVLQFEESETHAIKQKTSVKCISTKVVFLVVPLIFPTSVVIQYHLNSLSLIWGYMKNIAIIIHSIYFFTFYNKKDLGNENALLQILL